MRLFYNLSVLSLLVVCASVRGAPLIISPDNVTVQLGEFAQLAGSSHRYPTDLAPLGDGRLAVMTHRGTTRLLDSSGNFLDTEAAPYLDTRREPNRFTRAIVATTSLSFHPDFARPGYAGYGKAYTVINETHHTLGNPNLPDLFDGLVETANAHMNVLVEWTASDPSSNNPTWVRRDVVRMEQPNHNHNVADIAFGPDGLLYMASGDGGSPNRFTAPQDVTTYIGKMLRIDPLLPTAPGERSTSGEFITSQNEAYRIPKSNPGVGVPINIDEIFAYGFRSPFRMNFDQETGVLYVGDVGEGRREEISAVTLDGNYGWGRWEGTHELNPLITLVSGTTHTPPIFEYTRDVGGTVIGGFVYRGDAIPELQGKYVFGELGWQETQSQMGSATGLFYGDLETGEIFKFNVSPLGEQLAQDTDDGPLSLEQLISIGEDEQGELYLLVAGPFGQEFGRVFSVNPVPEPNSFLMLIIGWIGIAVYRRRAAV